jgi:DNA-binding SARP family transcriptional activator
MDTGGHRPQAQRGSGIGTLRLALLDGFELFRDGRPVALPLDAQRLMAFLALQAHPLQRSYVAGTLWLQATEDHAHASLRSALWRVRRCGTELVEASRQELQLAPRVSVDVREQINLAHRLLGPPAESEGGHYLLLEGELLPDWYDDWVLFERGRLHQLRLHALEAVSVRLSAQGRFGEAVDAAFAALRGDPLRESTHAVLMKAYLGEGNQLEAMRHYALYRDRLRSELGLEPSSELSELLGGLRPPDPPL